MEVPGIGTGELLVAAAAAPGEHHSIQEVFANRSRPSTGRSRRGSITGISQEDSTLGVETLKIVADHKAKTHLWEAAKTNDHEECQRVLDGINKACVPATVNMGNGYDWNRTSLHLVL